MNSPFILHISHSFITPNKV